MNDPGYLSQIVENPNKQNSELALVKLIENAVNRERCRELDLYKSYARDPEFKRAFNASISRFLSRNPELLNELLTDATKP